MMTRHQPQLPVAMRRIRELTRSIERLRTLASRRQQENLTMARRLAVREQEIDALWQVISDVSHELRTPTNGILGYADLLLDSGLDDIQQAFAQSLKVSANNLVSLVNNILDWSSLSSGAVSIDRMTFNLRVLVEDVADTLAVLAEQKALILASRVDRSLPTMVMGDPQYLRQVLMNLVGNAIKFTDTGEVVIAAEPSPESADDGDGWVRIRITDTGPGIAPELQHRIFQRFARIRSARPISGTGLGLTIARDLVEQMGGRIRVTSVVGQGATFYLDLPLPACEPEADLAIPPSDISGMRVLVADANATYRHILTTMLAGLGVQCLAVADGQGAVRALTKAKADPPGFDVVVMDLVLADMDGAALAHRIHTHPDFQHLPIVVLTSMTRRRQAQELEALGCRGYLTKPVRQSLLRDVIAEMRHAAPRKAQQPMITRHLIKERRFRNTTVLVADDSLVNARMTAAMLKNDGYSVSMVADGAQALDHVVRQPPEIVLLDLDMPVMSGMQAVRAIRQREAGGGRSATDRPMRVIAMTGHADDRHYQACLAAGFDSVLIKPFNTADLLQAVEETVDEKAHSYVSVQRSRSDILPLDLEKALKTALGDQEFLESLVADFILSTDDQLETLADAIANRDVATAVMGAHKIKGAAGSLKIDGMAVAAMALESALAEQGFEAATTALESLKDIFDHLKHLANRPGWASIGARKTTPIGKGAVQ